ncbi:hypothetical protein J7384_17095 [Endozoicomonas sp. G2_1]|uniref:hypothetical protein n=1 Tax=Endozoicomonas sp. G2_1 TaxID=2821091 RepID=UPI001ADB0006|nr:hypothetical protein [Endozoicomonas sp. G2_1]MBO9492081.1 hypothetical protein [Endozoicomonas sp. G2_1]
MPEIQANPTYPRTPLNTGKAHRLARGQVMTLPKSVQEAEQRANEIIQGNTENSAPDTDVSEQTSTTEQPTQQTETPAQTPTSNDVDWQKKYQVLQGKYNAEVPALLDRVKALESQAPQANEPDQSQEQEIARLKQQLAEAQRHAAAKDSITLNEHLVNEYGEEFARAVAQTANAQVDALRKEFDGKLSAQEKDISTWNTEAKMNSVKQSLASQSINFDLVDSDPLFHDWLRERDEYSGQSRQEMLMNAFNAGDLTRVTRFYSAYVDSTRTRSEQNPFNEHIQAQPTAAPDVGTTEAVFDPSAFEDLHRRYQRNQISEEEFQKAEREMYAALHR